MSDTENEPVARKRVRPQSATNTEAMQSASLPTSKPVRWLRRTHMCHVQIRRIRIPDYKVRGMMKPVGFWYQVGRSWERWCLDNAEKWLGGYLCIVEVDPTRILRITNNENFDQFVREFGLAVYQSAGIELIDWPKVKERYAGVEIAPYLWGKRLRPLWYYGWDVASGVVWDETAIRKVKTVKRPVI